jgi:DNA polymerase-1
MTLEGRRVLLIDGTAFCYRAFYAIRALATADGRPTNAVYGFATALQALQDRERPAALAVAFDAGKPTFRHAQFAAYKEHRKPMPEELVGQLPLVKQLLAAYRIPVFEAAGFEAEDLLATLARQLARGGAEVLLVTGDKDALQLVNGHVKVVNPQKDHEVMDAAAVKAQFGVGPEAIPDLLALMGDATDNIPGVKGIGPKTAGELLRRFGSVAQLYARLEEVPSEATRRQLSAAREQVALARELATIRTDAPVAASFDDLAVHAPDTAALRRLFRELEFKKMLRALDAPAGGACAGPGEAPPSSAEAQRALLAGAGPVSLAAFPAGEDRWLVAAARGEEAWSGLVNAAHPRESEPLRAWLADARRPKLAHDAKRLMRACEAMGTPLAGLAGDTMIAAHLVNPARTEQSLSDLSAEMLDEPLGPPPPLEGLLAEDPAARAYAARAARAVGALHERLLRVLEERRQVALYRDLELPLIGVLHRMESVGVGLDAPYLRGLQAAMTAQLARLTEQIHAMAGGEFNLNSPKQLGEVLFERLKLPVIKRGKTGPSTDSSVLQQLAAKHPLPKLLLESRELGKLLSTYVEALPAMVSPADGRLHTCLNQTATATGRLSSSDPNLQNIPIKTELGRSIRRAFVAAVPDGVLLAADYSQIELRLLAHLSGDDALGAAFREGRDIHRYTASLIYGLPEAEVQPEQRSAMKAVNFGILYGMTAHGLSQELGLDPAAAQAFIDAYFARYPKVKHFLDEQVARARADGYVETLLGRRRYVPELASPDPVVRQFGERIAVNAPVQGSAADLIKRAMVRLAAALPASRLSGRLILQVHDELLLETPRAELGRLAPLVRDTMEQAIVLDVPLVVTLKSGPNWLDLSPLT